MTTRLTPYAEYKDSGVPWLGCIPTHWCPETLGRTAVVQLSSVDKLSFEDETPVRLCNYVDVYKHSHITSDITFMEATAKPSEIERFTVLPGDVLVTKDSESWNDIAVPALISEQLTNVLCGYHLAHIRPEADKLSGGFLLRALQSVSIAEQFHVAANGVTRFGISKQAIKSGTIPIPPLEEQQAIARFLDRQDRRISRFIRAKRRLIELLNEQKQAIIHQAVTRGLDPDVPLKPSGIDWLGNIPAHWGLLSLGRVTNSRCDGPFGSGLKSLHYVDSGIQVVRLQNIGLGEFRQTDPAFISPEHYSTLGDHDVVAGDVLIAGLGDERNPCGRACVAPADIEPAMVKADCFRFRLDGRKVAAEFIVQQLSATALHATALLATGSTRQRINLSSMSTRPIVLPPLSEQEQIVNFLDESLSENRQFVSRILQEIDLIREYRTRLIADVVTGKFDVRNHPDAAEGGDEPVDGMAFDQGEDESIDDVMNDEEADDAVAD